MRVLLAALDSLHGICQCCTSLGPIKQGSVEGMDKNFGGRDRDRPQGHESTLSPSSQEGPGQSHNTICCHFAAGLLVRPAVTMAHKHITELENDTIFKSITFQALFAFIVFLGYDIPISSVTLQFFSTVLYIIMPFMSLNQSLIHIYSVINVILVFDIR